MISFILLFTNDRQKIKGRKGQNANAINLPQTSQYSLNIEASLEEPLRVFAGARSQKNTKLYINRPGET